MTFHKLALRDQLIEGYRQVFKVQGLSLLLLHAAGKTYAIENKCGHFGIPLANGTVVGTSIRCAQHGAEFDLVSGRVMNHVVAQCDPVRVFAVVLRGDDVGIELP